MYSIKFYMQKQRENTKTNIKLFFHIINGRPYLKACLHCKYIIFNHFRLKL